MKKTLIIIIILFLFTGCYDYHEVNDLAIITAIGIDYEDNNYIVSLEILNTNKTESNSSSSSGTTVVSGKSQEFTQACNDALKKVNNDAYFSHMQLLIISENMANKGIKDIIEYFFRSIHISDSFYTIVSKNKSPENILKLKIDNNNVVSNSIINMLKSNTIIAKTSAYKQFDYLTGTMESKGKDIVLPIINGENDNISLENIGVFDYDKMITTLDEFKTNCYYLLTQKVDEVYFFKDNNYISIYNNTHSIKLKNNKYIINLKLDADIEKLNDTLDLDDPNSLKYLKEVFEPYIKKGIENLIETSYQTKSDFLYLSNLYYKKHPKNYEENIGFTLNHEVNVELSLNKNGYIYEVMK